MPSLGDLEAILGELEGSKCCFSCCVFFLIFLENTILNKNDHLGSCLEASWGVSGDRREPYGTHGVTRQRRGSGDAVAMQWRGNAGPVTTQRRGSGGIAIKWNAVPWIPLITMKLHGVYEI